VCVQKTVNKGRFLGFFSGLGAATADTLYAVLAAFGVTFITNFLTQNRMVFQIIGIAVLLFMGFRMLFNNPIKQYRYYRTSTNKPNAIADYISVFFLTISNPLTIIFLAPLSP
jgi:threonine/homoserine/homoserine lactone efflux protein